MHAPLVVTAGEPAGIGPDLCLDLASGPHADRLVFIADAEMLQLRAKTLGLAITVNEYHPSERAAGDGNAAITVLPQELANPTVCGCPDTQNAASLLRGLERAVSGCSSGEFCGMVTAPLQKSTINDAGIPFSGHTEYLAELTATPLPVMLLVADDLRVALATTHMPLRAVAGAIDKSRLTTVIDVLHAGLVNRFRIPDPDILVCGLNPHAGEGGHLGTEEQDTIAPVIAKLRARGMRVRGPVPADTAFTPAAGAADVVLAMYHDQGLPVLKHAGFGHAVNVTLGLPIVRTSVDHGTALDLAGSGTADGGSMRAAVALALQLGAQ
jgi:4-hydroxythreonine-4-phosphate dehydrogenase